MTSVWVELSFVRCSEAFRAGDSVRVGPHEEVGIERSRNRYFGDGCGCDRF